MKQLVARLNAPDAEVFAPFGQFVTAPDVPGTRKFYSDSLHERQPASVPVLHVNHVPQSTLPVSISQVERHPHAKQCFFPLDVARYAVVVMPSDTAGLPQPGRAMAFLMPGNIGVIYNRDVWHLGATVFDRPGHFTVLMWRGGPLQDDELRAIPPLLLHDQT